MGLGLIVASASYAPAAYAQTPVLSPQASPVDVELPSADQVTEVVEPIAEVVVEAVEPATEALEPATEALEPATETLEPATETLEPATEALSTVAKLEPSAGALAGPAVGPAPAPSTAPQPGMTPRRGSTSSKGASSPRRSTVPAVELTEVRRRLQDRRSGDLEAVASGGDEIEDTQVLGREIERPAESALALTGFDLRFLLMIAVLLIGWGFRLAAEMRGRRPAGAR